MITITSAKDSFIVEFVNNDLYLDNGKMAIPMNALTLFIDESGIATFKRASNNDVLFSCLIVDGIVFDGVTATKDTIGTLFQNTCTAPMGIDEESQVTGVQLSQDGNTMSFVNASGDTIYSVNMSQYLTDIHITGASLVGDELTLYQSNGDAIVVDLEDMLADYYTQDEVDAFLDEKTDTSAFQSLEQALANAVAQLQDNIDNIDLSDYATTATTNTIANNVAQNTSDIAQNASDIADLDAALSNKQDTLTAGDNITIQNDTISSNQVVELTQADYDQLVLDDEVDPSKIYVITDAAPINLNNYTLTSTTAALQSTVSQHTTDIAQNASDIADLDTALNNKQDTLTAGTGISIQNNVISAQADMSNYYTKTEIDNAEQATSAALNDLNLRKLDASAYTPTDLSNYATTAYVDTQIAQIDMSSKLDATAFTSAEQAIAVAIANLQDELEGKAVIERLTAQEYENLSVKDANTLYIITDAQAIDMADYATVNYVDSEIARLEAIIDNINTTLTSINS